MNCVNHPKVETFLRCGKCDKPICTECMLIGPAGTRCRDCASMRSSSLYQVSIDRLALAVLAAVLPAVFGGYVIAAGFRFGFFVLWLALFFGAGIAEIVLRVTGRKRARSLEVASGACAFSGMLFGLAIYLLTHGATPVASVVVAFLTGHPFYALSIGVAVFGAVSRIRFY
jgi:hypothetical protein